MLKWVRKNPVVTGVGALAVAGLVVTAVTSGGFSPTSAYSGCGYGYGYDSTTYAYGYGTCPPTSTGYPVPNQATGNAPGGYTQVVLNESVPSGGGVVTGTYDGSQFSANIPASDAGQGVTIAITAPTNLSNADNAILGFGVALATNGVGESGTFAAPITITITNPLIKAGDQLVEWNGSAWVAYTDATVTNGSLTVTVTSDPQFALVSPTQVPTAAPASGYHLVGADGGIFNFGHAGFYGNTYTLGLTGLHGSHPLNAPIVGVVENPSGKGYWMVGADGGVFNFGGAKFYGSTYSLGLTGLSGSHPLASPVVGMAATPDGKGYWLVTKAGFVYSFGDASFYGDTFSYGLTGLTGAHPLAAPIVGIAADASGKGYWLVGADGGVFNFGDATFYGTTYSRGLTGLTGARPLAAPIVGIAATPDGDGYWLVGADGGIFNFGNAGFDGSTYSRGLTGLTGSHPLNAPIVGIVPTANGDGYWMVGKDGGVFNFGNAGFDGSTYSYGITGLSGAHPLSAPIVGIAD